MFQSLKKYSLALLVFLAGCANIADQYKNGKLPLPTEGDIYAGSVHVGIYDVPLPAGDWVVSLSQATATPKVPIGKVILVQEFEKALSNSVLIELPLGLDIVEYSTTSESKLLGSQFTATGESDIHHAFYTKSFYVAAPNTKKKTRGFSAPSLTYIAPTLMKASYYGKQYLKRTGLDFPPKEIFFRVGYQIVGSSNKIFISYFLDPRTRNISNAEGSLRNTPWDPDRHYLLSNSNKAFLKDLKAWNQEMLERILDAYDNRD